MNRNYGLLSLPRRRHWPFIMLALYLTRPTTSDTTTTQYTPSFLRTTQITTALDAGYWSAMHLNSPWLRDVSSILLSIYYILSPAHASAKVQEVLRNLTLQHIRVSWEKPITPCLSLLIRLGRPRKYTLTGGHAPRLLHISRPTQSQSKTTEDVRAWLYFNGDEASLAKQDSLVLDFPGGGFVAGNPRTHDDRLLAWARVLGIPIVSIEYAKAPEDPYPAALYDGFDVYRAIVESRGGCLGLDGSQCPRIVMTGDSAGGNLAVGTTFLAIQGGLVKPEGVFLAYPCLKVIVGSWLGKGEVEAIASNLSGTETGTETEAVTASDSDSSTEGAKKEDRLIASSILTHIHDRVLTPEHMRALILLYVGHHADLSTDYLLSPVLAPESLLAEFPTTRILTGECDPLVDDGLLFAGRLRQAQADVQVELVPGVSHGFLQMAGIFPEGWVWIEQSAQWIRGFLDPAAAAADSSSANTGGTGAVIVKRVDKLVESLR